MFPASMDLTPQLLFTTVRWDIPQWGDIPIHVFLPLIYRVSTPTAAINLQLQYDFNNTTLSFLYSSQYDLF